MSGKVKMRCVVCGAFCPEPNYNGEWICLDCALKVAAPNFVGNPHHESPEDFPEDAYVRRFGVPYCPNEKAPNE